MIKCQYQKSQIAKMQFVLPYMHAFALFGTFNFFIILSFSRDLEPFSLVKSIKWAKKRHLLNINLSLEFIPHQRFS